MAKRFTRIRFTRKRLFESALSKSWCTGEDSNLRSSQGAADLQSAAINHSATCAEMPILRTHHSSGNFRRGLSTRAEKTCRLTSTKIENRLNTLAHESHYTSEKFLMECVGKSAGAAATPVPPTTSA